MYKWCYWNAKQSFIFKDQKPNKDMNSILKLMGKSEVKCLLMGDQVKSYLNLFYFVTSCCSHALQHSRNFSVEGTFWTVWGEFGNWGWFSDWSSFIQWMEAPDSFESTENGGARYPRFSIKWRHLVLSIYWGWRRLVLSTILSNGDAWYFLQLIRWRRPVPMVF